MKNRILKNLIAILLLCGITSGTSMNGEEPKEQSKKIVPLTQEKQEEILHERLDSGSMIGRFESFVGMLYAMQEYYKFCTNSKEVGDRPLHTVHPDWYKPMRAEYMETMARQTGTHVTYDPKVDCWMFDEPEMPLPYTIEIADGWKEHNRGFEIGYVPSIAPVGMDIYMFGRYSGLDEKQKEKLIDDIGSRFYKVFVQAPKKSDFKDVVVDGCQAKFLETTAKRKDVKWRQWVFFKNGQAFGIVSSIAAENEDKLYPAVQKMVASFHVKEKPPEFPGL
ncbi:MAG: hypothetical protein SFY67_18060 [Candidatus Melainabacteria bacterium]|nr:hypothetical protein [Candidatus Melainabacteria bacterium]